MPDERSIVGADDQVLITGANGFIGSRVVRSLIDAGFSNLRCFVRPSSNLDALNALRESGRASSLQVFAGNLLSRDDCAAATRDVQLIFHLAAGIEKTFPGSFMNCVVSTRNLLDAAIANGRLSRFVNISSFAVYSNWRLPRAALLDEACAIEDRPTERAEAYAFAKLKQDELVAEYSRKHGVPYITLRPGAVYGPGARQISARVGIDTFGIFLHLGGGNRIPLTYVDNCAEAIVAAGLKPGIDGEIFNVVDDDLPSSRKFLRMYKRYARSFRSLYVPYRAFYVFCWLWEVYSKWSEGQLPPAFNRRRCATYWKGNTYSNAKLKTLVGWQPRVSFIEGSRRYFESVRKAG